MAVHAAPSAGGAPRDVLATLGNNRVARVPGRLPAPGSFNRARLRRRAGVWQVPSTCIRSNSGTVSRVIRNRCQASPEVMSGIRQSRARDPSLPEPPPPHRRGQALHRRTHHAARGPGLTSAWSTRMADSSVSSPSIPLATTSRSARPPADQKSGTMSRDRWAPSPETSQLLGRKDSNLRMADPKDGTVGCAYRRCIRLHPKIGGQTKLERESAGVNIGGQAGRIADVSPAPTATRTSASTVSRRQPRGRQGTGSARGARRSGSPPSRQCSHSPVSVIFGSHSRSAARPAVMWPSNLRETDGTDPSRSANPLAEGRSGTHVTHLRGRRRPPR